MLTDGFQVVLNPYWYYTLSLFPGILDTAFKIFATWFIAKVCWLIAREVCHASVDLASIKAVGQVKPLDEDIDNGGFYTSTWQRCSTATQNSPIIGQECKMHEIKPVLRDLIISLRACIPDRETKSALYFLRYALFCLEKHDARLAGRDFNLTMTDVNTIENFEFAETP